MGVTDCMVGTGSAPGPRQVTSDKPHRPPDIAVCCACTPDASFEAVVHITVPDSFPQDPPSVVLQSVAHLIQRLPVTERLAPMAWSPTWAVADMVAYVINVISKELLLFGKRVLESARAQAPLLARGQ